MSFGHSKVIHTNHQFEVAYQEKVSALLKTPATNRGNAHAMQDNSTSHTHELMYVQEHFYVDTEPSAWQETVKPNLPWAEDHFQERVGGEPLNPPPSEQWWPFARQGNAEHKKDQKFSHTYPERFWPKYTVDQDIPHQGIRFVYGDLNDLLVVLKRNPNSRQAYLPVWFPEDLHAAVLGERVPCSMGYHFIYDESHYGLDCVYTLRSCDIVRFYRDDVYMAGRLLQWVAQKVEIRPGNLVVNIDNLHCFPGDRPILQNMVRVEQMTSAKVQASARDHYNFEGLF